MRFILPRPCGQASAVVALCAVLPVAMLLRTGLHPSVGASAQHVPSGAHGRITPRRVAEFLRQHGRTPVSGAIYFRYTSHLIGDDPDGTVTQGGVLYVGPRGQLRLDLSAGTHRPIVCAVVGPTVWMIWGDSPLVYTSALPIQGDAAGWRGQLRAQAGQVLYWADVILARMIGCTPPSQVMRIERLGEILRVDLTASRRGFFPGPLSVHLVPQGPQWRIVLVEAGDTTLEYHGAAPLAGRGGVASQITMLRNTADGSRMNVWQVVDVLPLEDVGGTNVFAMPKPASRWSKRLAGELHFDAAGAEHLMIWK